MTDESHYRVVLDTVQHSAARGDVVFYTIVSDTDEGEMDVGTSWGDKDTAHDICDLMNMAFDAGVDFERALENDVKDGLR